MADNLKTSTVLSWVITILVAVLGVTGGFVLDSISDGIDDNAKSIENLTKIVTGHGLDINWQEAMDSSLVVGKKELKLTIMKHIENERIHNGP